MNEPNEQRQLATELAIAFLSGPWRSEAMAESGAACLGRWPDWMPALAERAAAVHRTPPRGGRFELTELVLEFLREHQLQRALPPPGPGRLARRPSGLRDLSLPAIASVHNLAERLELSDGQLGWLADVRGLERTVEREQLRNYRYVAVPRRGVLPRVIEAPKSRLKETQRWILHEILAAVPPHASAHGFTSGRSAVTHARFHTAQPVVLRLDLKDFFASVPAGRIYNIWRTLGYGAPVAHALTGLTTNVVPLPVWERIAEATPRHAVQARFWLGRQLATPHLPQGAPTSPALANLVAFRLDRRLAGLAGASGLRYSRYADDLTFSGAFRLVRRRARFVAVVNDIIRAEGFRLNDAKSMTQSAGGRQTVCGIVVNAHTNVRRSEYDRLKATLHNAARHGPASQNHAQLDDFRAHLLGRISWVESLNPARARGLHELFARIDWET